MPGPHKSQPHLESAERLVAHYIRHLRIFLARQAQIALELIAQLADRTGAIHRRERLGGMLNFYYRHAA
jgi:hypothetical protein